ncbi:ImmA/IrrE family metallo-endopeptidase [Levilactobacillus yiduensis]|uniref:ImmA/IrrE family metallo-endopeptidase n=1 Tax=Levilactobacillus yiduensis TaxID=2953880 RepID=UPI002157AC10|nr:ImmA/IrrE family metallo-endopeptidase [Levilactobacillus yiduensis]
MSLSKVEQLIDVYSKYVAIIEVPNLKSKIGAFGTFKVKNGKPYIFIDTDQPEIDKRVILTEEFMHFLHSVGMILDKDNLNQRKQELQARNLTYKAVVSIDDLLRCYLMGLETPYDVASELDLPEEFLKNAIDYFKTQYSKPFEYKGYVVIFSDTVNFYKNSIVKSV